MAGKDINIGIGASNQASAILEKVAADTQKLGGRVKTMARESSASTKTVEAAFNSLKTAAGPLLAAFAAFKAATGGFRLIGDAAAAFDKQEEAVRGLTTAIKLSGDAVGPTIEQHQAFASALQVSANIGDEVTLGLMKQASAMGVSNDRLQDVAKAALGLSEVTGQGLPESLKAVNAALSGNLGELARLVPAIDATATQEEKLAAISEVAAKGLALKADRAGTAAGSAERLANSWGDFLEVIGEALAPVRAFISNGLAVLVETIQAAVIPAMQSIMPSAETVAGAMSMMRDGIIKAVTMAEVVIGNLGNVWELLKTRSELSTTAMVESIKHKFTVLIPGYGKWFADNFFNLIQDAFTAAVTVVQNHIQSIAQIVLRLWDYVRSGFAGGADALFRDIGAIAAQGLLDGFEAKTEALPDIAARTITDAEKSLSAKAADLASGLSDAYQTKLAERMAIAGTAGADALATNLKANATDAAAAVDEVNKSTLEKSSKLIADATQKNKEAQSATEAVQSRFLTRGDIAPKADPKIAEAKGLLEAAKVTANSIGSVLASRAAEAVTNPLIAITRMFTEGDGGVSAFADSARAKLESFAADSRQQIDSVQQAIQGRSIDGTWISNFVAKASLQLKTLGASAKDNARDSIDALVNQTVEPTWISNAVESAKSQAAKLPTAVRQQVETAKAVFRSDIVPESIINTAGENVATHFVSQIKEQLSSTLVAPRVVPPTVDITATVKPITIPDITARVDVPPVTIPPIPSIRVERVEVPDVDVRANVAPITLPELRVPATISSISIPPITIPPVDVLANVYFRDIPTVNVTASVSPIEKIDVAARLHPIEIPEIKLHATLLPFPVPEIEVIARLQPIKLPEIDLSTRLVSKSHPENETRSSDRDRSNQEKKQQLLTKIGGTLESMEKIEQSQLDAIKRSPKTEFVLIK